LQDAELRFHEHDTCQRLFSLGWAAHALWDPGCATGFHLYYFERQQQWFINDRFDASKDEALAYADASDGKLPVGKMMWSMTDPDDKTEPTGEAELRLSLQKW